MPTEEVIYQGMLTKFLAPTNHRGSRVKAWCSGGILTVEWDHALNAEENHRFAANQLLRKMNWAERNVVVGGALPDGTGYCWVMRARKWK